ncbi:SOS response-associated peptidase [Curvibacter delicatus]|uniref:SOS response-associated peptidase n=1 Tax=Curvibacter delicatus TaxID=80879 RepID=UPI000837134C|nr:SOS response-associated peptidase [Curvibacter delicatus]
MCSHYQAPANPNIYKSAFDVEPPSNLGRQDVWPSYSAGFIRRHPHTEVGDDAVPDREALTGLFGMVPHWAKDTNGSKYTYNARSETVAEKPSFRDAWRKAQHCIIPADAFFEPDWSSGRAVPTMIQRVDGQPMGIAGLWSSWKAGDGQTVYSFTMLTINADQHPLLKTLHKPTDEKRMVVILPQERYGDWLAASAQDSGDFLQPYPADLLNASTPLGRPQLF